MIRLRRYLLTGIAVLLPIVLTGYIIFAVFNFAENLVGKHINAYLSYRFDFYIPGLGVVFAVLIIIAIGFVSSHFFGNKILPLLEKVFLRIPVVRQLYPSVKKIVLFFFSDKKQLFKQVVLIEYPRRGVWAVSFVTNEGFREASEKIGIEMLNVFIPGTPGPLTGFLIVAPKEDVIFLDISVEQALRLLVSGGVINP